MATVVNETVTEVTRKQASLAVGANPIYTRTVTFPLTDAGTAGTANLVGLKVPKGTMILGGSFKTSAAQGGSATFKFSLETDGDFTTAHAYDSTSRLALKTPIHIVATDQRQVTYTTTTAAVSEATCELTLICVDLGEEDSGFDTLDN